MVQTRQAWWALTVLALFNMMSSVDRSVMAILLLDIKADLNLSDFAISVIQGGGFAIFYSIAGVFIGGLIDRYPRRPLIFGGVSLWSLAAAGTGLAGSFLHMMGARVVVAVGEATITPGALSMLSQLFRRERLSMAVSVYVASGTIGVGVALGLGGWLLGLLHAHPLPGFLGDLASWRQVMIVIGLPGLLFALLIFTVKDPARAPATAGKADDVPGLGAFLRGNAVALIALLLVFGLSSMLTYANIVWGPSYGRRVIGMSAAEVGAITGAIIGIGGIVGAIGMGLLVDRLNARGRADAALTCYFVATAVSLPLGVLGYLSDDRTLYIVGLIAIQFGVGACFGPQMALMQLVAAPRMRGRAAALSSLISNVLGFGCGPVVVGALTDFVFGSPDKLGWSIATVILFSGTAAAAILWFARGRIQAAIAARS